MATRALQTITATPRRCAAALIVLWLASAALQTFWS